MFNAITQLVLDAKLKSGGNATAAESGGIKVDKKTVGGKKKCCV